MQTHQSTRLAQHQEDAAATIIPPHTTKPSGKKRSPGGAVKPSTAPVLQSLWDSKISTRSVWAVPSSNEVPQSEESNAEGTAWSTPTRQAARTLATPPSSKRVPGRGMTATDDEDEEEEKKEDDEDFEGDNDEDLLLDDVENPHDEQDGDGDEEEEAKSETSDKPRKRTRLSEDDSYLATPPAKVSQKYGKVPQGNRRIVL
ncbi:unnamed protein product [Fusarium equiseti]|uniref:Uncharacterized protein n=1 Tax=Fusarium equiseti TaxID=61235 RepID=A0A8J2IE20_FUSEQ|nr:unnamed protein product [Fusarium equiseti]